MTQTSESPEYPGRFKEIREYVSSLARLLHPQGDLAGANPSPNAIPTVSTEQTIFLRPVSQHLWVQDFREIINSIEHQGTIPLFIESLVADAKEKRAASESLGASESPGTRETVEALFPLPVNDEQLSILDAVETAAGVVVQGPPGTGKSHTIANLISHYLAQGARILVTSHSEKALSVLRNKLPEAIRQLSVSVLTSDSDSKRELQDSVRTIHSKLGSPNTRDKLEYLQNEVRVLKEKRRQTYHALIDTEERENTAVTFGNFSGTPLELSKRIAASKERDAWLKDVPNRELVFQLNDDQLKRLFKFLDVENVDFVDSLLLSTPDGSLLLSPDEFRDLAKEECFCEEALKESNGSSLGGRQDDLPNLERLHQLVANHVRGFRLFETEWIKKIAQEIKRDGASLPVWRDFLKKLKAEVEHLLAHDRKRLGANVESSVSSDADLNTAISAFEALATKAPPKSKISFFSKLTLPKSAKAILSGAKVHGKMVNAVDELQYLIADLSIKRCLLNIEQYHAFLAKRCGTPKPKAINELDLINEYSELIADLEFLLVTSHTSADSIKALSSSLRINLPAGFFDDEGRVRGLEKIIRLKIAEGKLASIRDKFLTSKAYLGKFDGQFHVHGSVRRLIEALDSRDPEAWASEIVALNLHKESSRHTSEVLPILKYLWELFPLTLNWIRHECSTETRSRLLSERWNDAISFHRAESFIGTVLAAPSPQRLRDDLVALEKQIENARGALIAAMAWFRQLGRITPSEREALKAWDQAVTDLGKGTGRKDYVERKRRAVRDAMRRAVSAVPVWIMPLHRVVESFHPPEPGLFELVIVDESSQCDLRALSVLYRGKKVIVVGDDKQVSPENTGVDRSKVNSLIQQFLHDIPFKERFSIDDSLYNVASLRLPQTIMLREHFRCVPEIIEFSNHNFYKNPAVRDSGLVPMRLPLPEERIPEPLKAVFVPGQRENNVNLVEAQAIAEKLAELIKDPQYEKKTFGVITLIANPAQSEAIQKLVHASIPQSEIRARKIQIGDPKWFQGDERDVVLLSMVVGGPDDSFAAQTKASDQRRFNVAASRARDQMWLFHSVRSSEIQNPECLRLKLLTFFAKSTVEVPVSPSGRPLNEFETAVAKMILARGYEVLPQFPAPGSGVMRYIDLVVQGSSSRLAIECDGDRWHGRSQWEADQRRENQLRRAGWTFWRVRGTEFYRNPEEALLPLWDKLAEMGIHPSKAKTLVS